MFLVCYISSHFVMGTALQKGFRYRQLTSAKLF